MNDIYSVIFGFRRNPLTYDMACNMSVILLLKLLQYAVIPNDMYYAVIYSCTRFVRMS